MKRRGLRDWRLAIGTLLRRLAIGLRLEATGLRTRLKPHPSSLTPQASSLTPQALPPKPTIPLPWPKYSRLIVLQLQIGRCTYVWRFWSDRLDVFARAIGRQAIDPAWPVTPRLGRDLLRIADGLQTMGEWGMGSLMVPTLCVPFLVGTPASDGAAKDAGE